MEMSEKEARKGASRRSLMPLATATVLGIIHHTDHVLRVDHSGWPLSQAEPWGTTPIS